MKRLYTAFGLTGSLLLCAGLALADGGTDPATPPADPTPAQTSPAAADSQAQPADSQAVPTDPATTPAGKTGTAKSKSALNRSKKGATGGKTSSTKASVIIGSTTCFLIHECVAGETPQQRADHINDVFNKYLGGSSSTFGVKRVGKNAVITMNKDQLLLVTPQDAKTAKAKNSYQLATAWKASLAKAFNETKATK